MERPSLWTPATPMNRRPEQRGQFADGQADRARRRFICHKSTAERHVASAVCGTGLAPESWAESNKCGQERIADAEA